MLSQIALEQGKQYSASGSLMDPDVTTPEAYAQMLGLPTQDAVQSIETSQAVYEKSRAHLDDVEKYYKDLKRFLAADDMPVDDMRTITKMMSIAWKHFDNHPTSRAHLLQLIKRDVKGGDDLLFRRAMKLMGILTPQENSALIENGPWPEEQKQILRDAYKQIEKSSIEEQ